MRSVRIGSTAVVLAGAALILGSCSKSPKTADAGGEYEKLVLGKVAGKDFTVADLENKLKYQYGKLGDIRTAQGIEDTRKIVDSAIDEMCWVTLGEKKGYQKEKQFKDTWELSRKFILADRTIEHEVRSKETPTDDEICRYYDEHPDEFKMPLRVQIAHVLVKSQNEALQVRARLLKGEPVASLAKSVSIDEQTKNSGGMLGWMTATSGAGHLGNIPYLNTAAVALQKGEVSRPVEIPSGWSVMVALDRVEQRVMPYDDNVAEALRKKVQTKKHNQLFNDELEKLRKEYGAEIYKENFEKFAMSILPENELLVIAQRDQDPDRRIRAYQEVMKRFSNGPNAAQAQFMIGFILADERKDYPAARQAFQAYIQKYPDTDLVASARWMLDNMEKPDADRSEMDQFRQKVRGR
jgi:peptidyl-prolyl cis-trans isomerase C